MPFQYTFRADDITTWEAETRDLVENRDRELELYSTTIDTSFLNLNASNLTSGTVPSACMTGAYTGITGLGALTSLDVQTTTGTAVRITNTGTGNSFLVEDSASTDTTPFVIDSSGQVGIGTVNPQAGLGVFGSPSVNPVLRINNGGTGPCLLVEDTTGTDSTPFVIDATGRVGIGMTNPARSFDVIGSIRATSSATQDGIEIYGNGTGTSSRSVSIYPATLTGNQNFILPNATGTGICTGNLSSITAVGTLASGSIPASLLTGTTLPATIVTSSLTSVGTITSGTWSGSFGAVSGANLTSLNASNLASGNVPGGRVAGSYTGITGVGTLTQELNVSGAACGFGFADRSGTGERFVWYSTSADAFLFSTRLSANVIGVARTTGITYLYYGIAGTVQYGSFGSMALSGTTNGYAGFSNTDTTSAVIFTNSIFGHYRNNTTWNFYVSLGTYVPSDARYKRDIRPIEQGMNLIRHITPVSYDPLTENPDDDPETTVGRTHYGFTTQNVLEALELSGETRDVAVVDIGGPDSSMGGDRQYLNHSALIAPMVKAIQELDARLQQLETT